MEKEEKAFGVGHLISMNQCGRTAARADVIPGKECPWEGVLSAMVPDTSEIPSGVFIVLTTQAQERLFYSETGTGRSSAAG